MGDDDRILEVVELVVLGILLRKSWALDAFLKSEWRVVAEFALSRRSLGDDMI